MPRVSARRVLPGATVAEAEALWHDLGRWSGFVDGFARVGRLEGDWPQPGARLVWDSLPKGRGRVVERVVALQPGASLLTRVEDPQLHGEQTVRFAAVANSCEMTLELAYDLKRPGFGGKLTDMFFVRHALRDSLQRTLHRFAIELQSDRELT